MLTAGVSDDRPTLYVGIVRIRYSDGSVANLICEERQSRGAEVEIQESGSARCVSGPPAWTREKSIAYRSAA